MQLTRQYSRQRGLTLVEVLVGLAVGFIVVGGAIVIYTSSVQSSNDTLKSSRLNQEIAGLMLVIANDVRRAGYWDNVDGLSFGLNPFNQPGATALVVRDNMANDVQQGPTGQGSCITYAYDATYLAGNTPGVLDSADLFGFRLNGGVVEMRQSGTVDGVACVGGTCLSCANGVWANVTDANLIEVTALTFDLSGSGCLNAAEPDLIDDNGDGIIDDDEEYNCYVTIPAAGSGNTTAESREVLVSLSARLTNDVTTQVTAAQTITVRNDVIRVR
jgi:type IV pilus assembly protein PilW